MNPRFLLDTHIAVLWLAQPKKLSREQIRVLEDSVRRGECLGLSAFSLIEIVMLAEGRKRIVAGAPELLLQFDTHPAIRIVPITMEVAKEMAAIGDSLRDPGDRIIVATARVHGLRLLTADERIILSRLVPVIE